LVDAVRGCVNETTEERSDVRLLPWLRLNWLDVSRRIVLRNLAVLFSVLCEFFFCSLGTSSKAFVFAGVFSFARALFVVQSGGLEKLWKTGVARGMLWTDVQEGDVGV
jgi:hypothetical protein